jgi:hypothetical protein
MAFIGGEFIRVGFALGVGATVKAREVAGLGHLPKNEERPVIETPLQDVTTMVASVNLH